MYVENYHTVYIVNITFYAACMPIDQTIYIGDVENFSMKNAKNTLVVIM